MMTAESRESLSTITATAAMVLVSALALAAPQPPNILLLVADDQPADTIAALGNDVIRTPNLDRLAARGTSFTRATCANPICTPSRAEILTGCSGFTNGVLDFGGQIHGEIPRWSQTMRDAGYHAWYTGKWHNDGKPVTRGYAETGGLFAGGGGKWWKGGVDYKGMKITGYGGWVFQDDEGNKFPDQGVGLTPDISAKFADAAIEFLNRKPDQPFFLHVNFTAPHDPLLVPPGYADAYDPEKIPLPKSFRPEHPFDHGNLRGRDEKLMAFPRTPQEVRRELAVFYAIISHLDAQVGRILAALKKNGQAENTVVIFTSDHGLAMGRHGLRGKQNMYEHTINVPLILAGPGIPKGKRADAQCYLRDLFPTACELCGIDIPDKVEGRSLVPVIRGQQREIYPHIYGYFRNFQRMIRTDRYKLIHYPHLDRWQLFDLQEDPHELKDLSPDENLADPLQELKAKLNRWQRAQNDPALHAPAK